MKMIVPLSLLVLAACVSMNMPNRVEAFDYAETSIDRDGGQPEDHRVRFVLEDFETFFSLRQFLEAVQLPAGLPVKDWSAQPNKVRIQPYENNDREHVVSVLFACLVLFDDYVLMTQILPHLTEAELMRHETGFTLPGIWNTYHAALYFRTSSRAALWVMRKLNLEEDEIARSTNSPLFSNNSVASLRSHAFALAALAYVQDPDLLFILCENAISSGYPSTPLFFAMVFPKIPNTSKQEIAETAIYYSRPDFVHAAFTSGAVLDQDLLALSFGRSRFINDNFLADRTTPRDLCSIISIRELASTGIDLRGIGIDDPIHFVATTNTSAAVIHALYEQGFLPDKLTRQQAEHLIEISLNQRRHVAADYLIAKWMQPDEIAKLYREKALEIQATQQRLEDCLQRVGEIQIALSERTSHG